MPQQSRLLTVPVVLYFVGLTTMFVGVIPLLGRRGGPLELGLAIGGASLIALGIVLAARTPRAGPGPGSDRGA